MSSNEADSEATAPLGVDLGACEREPIHTPGAIQPYGCLLLCAVPTWRIVSVSANAGEFLAFEAASLIDRPLDSVLGAKTVHDLRNVLQAAMVSGTAERLVDVRLNDDGPAYDLVLHMAGPQAGIEVIPRDGAETLDSDPLNLVKSIITRLKRAPTLERFLSAAAQQVRSITGFDRVMIYKFLNDGSGQVVAEALRSAMPPFLGLRYPESDIPAQARALYKRQWLRLIPNVDYRPVPLLSAGQGGEIDLSLATLRSVSPVHLEYLRNMGSAATLTISLMQADRLWGLIACHHDTPRRLSSSICAAAELFAQIFSLQIEAKEQSQQLRHLAHSRTAHDRLLANMSPEQTIFDDTNLFGDTLREMIPCDGVGVWSEDGFVGQGNVLPAGVIQNLIEALDEKSAVEVFATEALGELLPVARPYAADCSGILVLPFSGLRRTYLLFFRREVVQTVTWGGNPNKPVEIVDGGARIGPRKSFEAWRETVRGRSAPWLASELKVAEALRVSLLDIILRRADLKAQARRTAHDSQTLLIAELNHRVKNILALVGSLVRQSRQAATSVDVFAEDLEHRVRALGEAHDQLTAHGWTSAPLRGLLEAEARAWAQAPDRISLEGPPIALDSRAFQALALVFHEMMTNAAKYGCLSVAQGRLSVTWARDSSGDLRIAWRERGGPAVEAPRQRGFGSLVVEQTIPFELGGEASVDYPSEGVVGVFRVPAAHVDEGIPEIQPERGETPPGTWPVERLLLVEDSMMIALDVRAMLGAAGLDVEVAGTLADARQALEAGGFEAAILDINLSGAACFDLADELQRRGLPFVFATGYSGSIVVPDRFEGVQILPKPYDESALKVAFGRVFGRLEAETQ